MSVILFHGHQNIKAIYQRHPITTGTTNRTNSDRVLVLTTRLHGIYRT